MATTRMGGPPPMRARSSSSSVSWMHRYEVVGFERRMHNGNKAIRMSLDTQSAAVTLRTRWAVVISGAVLHMVVSRSAVAQASLMPRGGCGRKNRDVYLGKFAKIKSFPDRWDLPFNLCWVAGSGGYVA